MYKGIVSIQTTEQNQSIMKFNIVIPTKFICLAIFALMLSSCDDGPNAVNPVAGTNPPVINSSPGDFTVDLTGQSNSCSQIVTLSYNLEEFCGRVTELDVSLDAAGLVSQTSIAANGDISFEVEFCALEQNVPITLTVQDNCGGVATDEIVVDVIGEDCIDFFCQKFDFGMDPDGTKIITASIFEELTALENACDRVEVKISFSETDITDTIATYTCDDIINNNGAINPNLNDSLFYWAGDKLIDQCRIVIFFENDPNGDGDISDGWQEICDL